MLTSSPDQRLSRLRSLLTAPEPEVVYQGVTLAADLGDAALYAALLARTRLEGGPPHREKVAVVPGGPSGPDEHRNLRTAATLALIADAPDTVGIARQLRARITHLELVGEEREGAIMRRYGPARLWHLDRLPALEAVSIQSARMLHARRLPTHLAALHLLRSPVPLEALTRAGLQRLDQLHIFRAPPREVPSALSVGHLSLRQFRGDARPLLTLSGLTSLQVRGHDLGAVDLGVAQALRRLNIAGLPLSDLSSLDQLPHLTTLRLVDLPNLRTLPDLSGLPLRSVTLDRLSIEALPPLPDGASLQVRGCRNLPAADHTIP